METRVSDAEMAVAKTAAVAKLPRWLSRITIDAGMGISGAGDQA